MDETLDDIAPPIQPFTEHIDDWRTVDVHGRRAAAEDHAGRRPITQFRRGDGVRNDLGVDVRLAHTAGDQLGVLRAEVDDEDGLLRPRSRDGQCPIPMPWARWRFLPSVCNAGATITSAFWNSFTDS